MKLTQSAYVYLLLTIISALLFYYCVITYGFNSASTSKEIILAFSIAFQSSALLSFNILQKDDECYDKCFIAVVVISILNPFSVMLSLPFLITYSEIISQQNKKYSVIEGSIILFFATFTISLLMLLFFS